MFHIVYQITNLKNGKIYIGKHSTENINDFYMGGGKAILKAIKKYGIENFKKEILSEHNTSKEAFKEERKIVTEEFVKRKDTYNLMVGGMGSILCSNETKLKISKSLKNPNEETRKKISEANKGRKWIFNIELNINKMILQKDLYEYLLNGWIKGYKLTKT